MKSNRDQSGRFCTGHDVGQAFRFQKGQPSSNPSGRPWGVKKRLRVLRSRRYHQGELETVITDDHAPATEIYPKVVDDRLKRRRTQGVVKAPFAAHARSDSVSLAVPSRRADRDSS